MILIYDFVAVLDEIRYMSQPHRTFGMERQACERWLELIAEPLICGTGSGPAKQQQYHRFVKVVAQLFRANMGAELAFRLELAVRSWSEFELDPDVMQAIVCRIHEQIKLTAWAA